MIIAPLADVQAWNRLEGKVTSIVVVGRAGRRHPSSSSDRCARVLPRSLEVKTGAAGDRGRAEADQRQHRRVPQAGAARLLGRGAARRRVHHLQHVLDHGRAARAASSRCCARSARPARQVLAGVGRRGAAPRRSPHRSRACSPASDSPGARRALRRCGHGDPARRLGLAPRTIVVGLTVGIGVTAAAAVVPAVRATRVPPVAAMREGAAPTGRRAAPAAPARRARRPRGRGAAGSRPVRRRPGVEPAGDDGCRLDAPLRRGRDARAPRRPAARGARRLAAGAPGARDRRARPRQRDTQPGPHRDHRRDAHGRHRPRRVRGGARGRPEDLVHRRRR